ncbi:MAG: hypothetical protein P8N19_07705 [Flavobacteriales bacterium]|nr:hypothetical protein [Flavobacteriales bacterium]MDG1766903.1 hypothetical protein [Flavobacteriales bacterium]
MNITEEKYHEVLQKLIMLFLGLLTMSVVLTSCHASESCAAYGDIDHTEHPLQISE